LGISASIAAYKAPEIVRNFVGSGVSIQAILTPKATDFIGRSTLEALTGNVAPTFKDIGGHDYLKYIKLAKKADLIVIAPATANIIAHIAHGLASDLLETLVLARGCPLLIAPAMNENMWNNDITQENVKKLKSLGVDFVGPAKGDLACGDEGTGRLASIEDIIAAAKKIIENK